jgi:hypothetical protein
MSAATNPGSETAAPDMTGHDDVGNRLPDGREDAGAQAGATSRRLNQKSELDGCNGDDAEVSEALIVSLA